MRKYVLLTHRIKEPKMLTQVECFNSMEELNEAHKHNMNYDKEILDNCKDFQYSWLCLEIETKEQLLKRRNFMEEKTIEFGTLIFKMFLTLLIKSK